MSLSHMPMVWRCLGFEVGSLPPVWRSQACAHHRTSLLETALGFGCRPSRLRDSHAFPCQVDAYLTLSPLRSPGGSVAGICPAGSSPTRTHNQFHVTHDFGPFLIEVRNAPNSFNSSAHPSQRVWVAGRGQ